MANELVPEAIVSILLSDGAWHAVKDYEPLSVNGPAGVKWPSAFRAIDLDNPARTQRWLTGPMSSVLAFSTKYVPTAEDEAARRQALSEAAEAQFVAEHYCSSQAYMDQAEKQAWLCTGCGVALQNVPIAHLVPGRGPDGKGEVLCEACSPMKSNRRIGRSSYNTFD